MHLLALRALSNALRQTVRGCRVRRAGLLDSTELLLQLEDNPTCTGLVLSVRPGAPHVRIVEHGDRPARIDKRLTHQLGPAAEQLAGCTLAEIAPLGWERLLAFELTPHPNANVQVPITLFFEMLPRTPFVVICEDRPPVVLAAVRAPGTRRPDSRSMERGQAYAAPFGIAVGAMLDNPLGDAIDAVEVAWRDSDPPLTRVLRGVDESEIERVVAGADDGATAAQRLVGYLGPLTIDSNSGPVPALTGAASAEAVLHTCTSWGRELPRHERRSRAHTVVSDHVTRSTKRALRALRAAERDQQAADRAPELRRHAEALLASLHTVTPGQSRVTLTDPYDGARIELQLDTRKRPQDVAATMFQEARRLERRAATIDARVRELRAEQDELLALRERLADPGVDPATIASELIAAGQLPKDALEEHPAPGEKPERQRYKRYVLPSGWEVWVGRSNADNDVMTHRLAAPTDIWLHASGVQGAHVILRRPQGYQGTPPHSILLEAAGIAAAWSKAKHSAHVPVIYTERRYVRKPRRSPPGTAVCLQEKTVMAEPQLPAND